jgi:acyl dehydratase
MSNGKIEDPKRIRVTSIDQLKEYVGQELGVGPWLTMTQDRINAFADATGDHQWIHVDPERCKSSGRGKTIAHGYLTLSLITLLGKGMEGVQITLDSKVGINYGSDRVRFITPVREGSRIRLRSFLLSTDPVSSNVWQVKYKHVIEIEGEEKPAVVAEALNRIYF